MQLIHLDNPPDKPAPRATATLQDAMAGVVATIGDEDFGHAALAALNRCLPFCWMSVYRLFHDRPPAMYAAGSFEVADGTRDSWKAYRASLYRHDETFEAAREGGLPGDRKLVHWNAREIPQTHREQIYSRFGLRERLSLVSTDADAALLAVNLYRHESQAPLADDEIDRVGEISALLIACVRRHIATAPKPDVMSSLTVRERDVCTRMLKGWTHDGIAADLGVSSSTVKTYRDRAFDRLGIHHRNELFALIAGHLERDAPEQA